MSKSFQLIIILTFLTGCGYNDKPAELYRQRIANSSLVIYDFFFNSLFVTTSMYKGFAVLDSTVSLTRGRIRSKELPCTYFSARPTSSKFKMIDVHYGFDPRTEKDTLLTPKRSYSEEIDNVQIDVTEYDETYGYAPSTGLANYEFDRFRETADSLTLYNVTKVFGSRQFPSTVSFAKGNIKVIDSTNYNIHYIQIEQVIIQRGGIYKDEPTGSLELVPNQPVVGMATYWFYPRIPTKSTTLTDYGIFKRVR